MKNTGWDLELATRTIRHVQILCNIYVAKDQRLQLVDILSKAKYFSIQIDGSTDSANVKEEVFLTLYFNPYSDDRKVHVQDKLLAIQ